jgi:capsular polysaccharide transport system ATP-binding protein
MITLDHVQKAYRTIEGRRVVLRDATVSIPEGCGLGVLGANGAGKSTLIRLLAGTEPPDAGRITRGGRAVSFPLGFGGILHPKLSGRENMLFLARLYGIDEHEAVDYAMKFAELGSYFHMPVGTYSSGMRTRLAFAACLAVQFDVYLIDEVTAVGDGRFRAKCLDAFHQRMDRADVIMVSHDYATKRAYCDAGAVLYDGRLILFDDLEEAIDHHASLLLDGPTRIGKVA